MPGSIFSSQGLVDDGDEIPDKALRSAVPLEAMAVPQLWPSLAGTTADWSDRTVPQQINGAVLDWPRGRALGGSSSINAMSFNRGHRIQL